METTPKILQSPELKVEPISADQLMIEAREELPFRLQPTDAYELFKNGAKLIDTRSKEDRQNEGTIPDIKYQQAGETLINKALVVHPNVLPWRADPSEAASWPELTTNIGEIVIVSCNDGYSSSIYAAQLQKLGYLNATDIDGGLRAWKAAGLPWQVTI